MASALFKWAGVGVVLFQTNLGYGQVRDGVMADDGFQTLSGGVNLISAAALIVPAVSGAPYVATVGIFAFSGSRAYDFGKTLIRNNQLPTCVLDFVRE